MRLVFSGSWSFFTNCRFQEESGGVYIPQVLPWGITMVSKPHSSSFLNSSPGVAAVSKQSWGNSRVFTSLLTVGCSTHLIHESVKSLVVRTVCDIDILDLRGEPAKLSAQGGRGLTGSADGPQGNLIRVRVAEEDIVVAVVILGSGSHLGPLPTHERDEVGVLGIARYGVALADRLHRVLPVLRSVGFRVIGNPVEVQLGDIACIVTGVGRGI